MLKRTLGVLMVVVAAGVLMGCGGDDGDDAAATSGGGASTSSTADSPSVAGGDAEELSVCMGVKQSEMADAVGAPVTYWYYIAPGDNGYGQVCKTAAAEDGQVSVKADTYGEIGPDDLGSWHDQVAADSANLIHSFPASGSNTAFSALSLPEEHKGANASAWGLLANGKVLHVQIFVSDPDSPLIGSYKAQAGVEKLFKLYASRAV